MNQIILKLGLICWGFVGVFVTCLIVAMSIPANWVGWVTLFLGLLILAFFIYDLRNIYLREGFDFGWFLAVKKGFWRMLVGLIGLGLFATGFLATVFPTLANELGEKHWLKVASLLVILFWTALIFTFLSWSLVCFSEATLFWRQGKLKPGLGSFGLGLFWLLFVLLFLSLFLEVINDIFFALSGRAQNWILGIFAILSILVGLWSGRYENPKQFSEKEN